MVDEGRQVLSESELVSEPELVVSDPSGSGWEPKSPFNLEPDFEVVALPVARALLVALLPSSDETPRSSIDEESTATLPLLALRLFLATGAAAFCFVSLAARFLARVALARAAVRALRRAVYSALVSFNTVENCILAIIFLESIEVERERELTSIMSTLETKKVIFASTTLLIIVPQIPLQVLDFFSEQLLLLAHLIH